MSESKWGSEGDIWATISPPLVPRDSDIELVHKACPIEAMSAGASPRVLMLGVTPQLIDASWPPDSEIHAVDYDPVMVEALWHRRNGAQCHLARWQEMPFPDEYFDLVVGDCSFNALPALSEYDDVLREVRRVSKPSAVLISRFFLQQQPRLTLPLVMREARTSFAHFDAPAKRLLILIAATDPDGSVNFGDIASKVLTECGDMDRFLTALGQEGEAKERAMRIFSLNQRLNYPDQQQIEEIFGRYFGNVSFSFPDYDCGQFCPIVSFSSAHAAEAG